MDGRVDWSRVLTGVITAVILGALAILWKPIVALISGEIGGPRGQTRVLVCGALLVLGVCSALLIRTSVRRSALKGRSRFAPDEVRLRILVCPLSNDATGYLTKRIGSALDKRFSSAVIIHRWPAPLDERPEGEERNISVERSRSAAALRKHTNADLVIYGDASSRGDVVDLYFSAGDLGRSLYASVFKLDEHLRLSNDFDEVFDTVISCVTETYLLSRRDRWDSVDQTKDLSDKIGHLMQDERLRGNVLLNSLLGDLLEEYGTTTYSFEHLRQAVECFDRTLNSPNVPPLLANGCKISKAQALVTLGWVGKEKGAIAAALDALLSVDLSAYERVSEITPAIVKGARGSTRSKLAIETKSCSEATVALAEHAEAIEVFQRLGVARHVALARRERAQSLKHARVACQDLSYLERAIEEWQDLSDFDFGTPKLQAALYHELGTALFDYASEVEKAAYYKEALQNLAAASEVFRKDVATFTYYEILRVEARSLHGLSYLENTLEVTEQCVEKYLELLASGELHRDWHDRGDIFYYAGCKTVDLGRARDSSSILCNALDLFDESYKIFAENGCRLCMARARVSAAQAATFYSDYEGPDPHLDIAEGFLSEASRLLLQEKARCSVSGDQMRRPLYDGIVMIRTLIRKRRNHLRKLQGR